jgi:hypothetical protein
MEKIRGNIEGIIWLDDFAFVPQNIGLSTRYVNNKYLDSELIPNVGKICRIANMRNSSLEYKLKSSFINLELLKRNNKIRIKEFIRYSYDGK